MSVGTLPEAQPWTDPSVLEQPAAVPQEQEQTKLGQIAEYLLNPNPENEKARTIFDQFRWKYLGNDRNTDNPGLDQTRTIHDLGNTYELTYTREEFAGICEETGDLLYVRTVSQSDDRIYRQAGYLMAYINLLSGKVNERWVTDERNGDAVQVMQSVAEFIEPTIADIVTYGWPPSSTTLTFEDRRGTDTFPPGMFSPDYVEPEYDKTKLSIEQQENGQKSVKISWGHGSPTRTYRPIDDLLAFIPQPTSNDFEFPASSHN